MPRPNCTATPVSDAAICAEIAPCFVDDGGRRTDTVVLACTHYPLLLERLERLAPWPVTFLDPAPAIARRVVDLLGPAGGARGARGHADDQSSPPDGSRPPALAARLAPLRLLGRAIDTSALPA